MFILLGLYIFICTLVELLFTIIAFIVVFIVSMIYQIMKWVLDAVIWIYRKLERDRSYE